MHKKILIAGAIFGALGVALGAFGAHGLQKLTQDEKILHSFQTGVQYQIYHALALLFVGLIYDKLPVKHLRGAGICFIAGVLLFSGSLYLLAFLKINESDISKIVGPVTPIGGLFLIAGWLLLFIAFLRKK
ncbi:MAG: DUF423 domain-containing protein [Chitinophagaceae bacterium]